MQPHTAAPRKGKCPHTTTGERRAWLHEQYPGWDFWHVRAVVDPGTWCGKPSGAICATCNAGDLDTFIWVMDNFIANLAGHIEEARRELQAPRLWPDRRNVVERQLSAMMRLQSLRDSATTGVVPE